MPTDAASDAEGVSDGTGASVGIADGVVSEVSPLQMSMTFWPSAAKPSSF
jgi:hypothetical protein